MMLSAVCLTSVAYIRSAGGVCDRPAGWRVLADRARLGRPGSRLPLRASVSGIGATWQINTKMLSTCRGGSITWRPPTYSLFLQLTQCRHQRVQTEYWQKFNRFCRTLSVRTRLVLDVVCRDLIEPHITQDVAAMATYKVRQKVALKEFCF